MKYIHDKYRYSTLNKKRTLITKNLKEVTKNPNFGINIIHKKDDKKEKYSMTDIEIRNI